MPQEEISPEALRDLLASEPVVLLDVREPWETALCALQGSRCVPMDSVPDALDALDPAAVTVVICHHGVRSHHVAEYLRANGFAQVLNLEGGIHRWAVELDPTMARY